MATSFNPVRVREAFFAYAEQHDWTLYTTVEVPAVDQRIYAEYMKSVLVPRKDTDVSRAFWYGYEGRKNQQQFPKLSKLEAIYHAGQAYFELSGKVRGMRRIVVNDKLYHWQVNETCLTILYPDGHKTVLPRSIGPLGRTERKHPDRYRAHVIAPNIVAHVIKHGKPPLSYPGFCDYHNLFVKDAATCGDPYDAEIHGTYTPVLACAKCLHERWMDT